MKEPSDKNKPSRRTFVSMLAAASCPLFLAKDSISADQFVKPNPKPKTGGTMDIDKFVADCIEANQESDPQQAVKEVLARVTSNPNDIIKALGEPKEAGINLLHRSKTLTIFNATWTPQMNLMPHTHLMWALIGIYTGREDNIMWRRSSKRIEAFDAKALFKGDVADLPHDVIHSVTNPLRRYTGGIHIYGGDFFDTTRSQWDPETLTEETSDGAKIRKMFEQENKIIAQRNCVV